MTEETKIILEKLDKIDTGVGKLESRMERLESKVDKLDIRIGKLESRMEELESKVDKLDIRVGKLECRMEKLESKVDKLDIRIGKLESKMEELESKVEELESKVKDLDTRTEKLESQVTGIKLILENEIRSNIQIVAEAHLDLYRKLDEAVKVKEEREMLLVRTSVLESDVRILKEKVDMLSSVS